MAVVKHGDDASEEDYSKVGNCLLSAIADAARDYGYDLNLLNPGRTYTLVDGEFANPMVAELADGTRIVARSESFRGPGWIVDSRPPTAQEHAHWAGLPVPPEPPAPPPAFIDQVFGRLREQEGTIFTTSRGKEFTYSAFAFNLWIEKHDGRGTSIDYRMITAALEVWPVPGPTALPIECGHGQRTYVWALLADRRIVGVGVEPLL